MNNKNYWLLGISLNVLSFVGLYSLEQNNTGRNPASAVPSLQLEIKSIQLPLNTSLQNIKEASLIATFDRTQKIDLLGNKKLSLNQGQNLDLGIKIKIDNSWVRNDQVEFKLELVKTGFIDKILLRCAQVSKKLSEYNRSYQCFLPDNPKDAVITYRVSNDAIPTLPQSLAKK